MTENQCPTGECNGFHNCPDHPEHKCPEGHCHDFHECPSQPTQQPHEKCENPEDCHCGGTGPCHQDDGTSQQ